MLKLYLSIIKKSLFAILVLALIHISLAIAGEYHIVRVVDGDTLEVDHLSKRFIVRLVGIDAPELGSGKHKPSQPFAVAAKKHLIDLIDNRIVDVEPHGPDRYGRILAVLYADNDNVNIEMLKAGLAEVYRGGYPVAGLDRGPYWESEKEAREAKRGMWIQGNKYVSPRDWRKGH